MSKRASIYASFLLIIGLLSPVSSFGATEGAKDGIGFDLNMENVGILPISPLYFLKEIRRDLMRLFITNPVSEAILELQIANEKAAELKKVQEFKPNDVSAISKAIENYKESQTQLSAKLEEIKNLPRSRASGKLVEELAVKAVAHEGFLHSLEGQYTNQEQLKDLTESAKQELEKTTKSISRMVPADELVHAVRKTFISPTTPVASDDVTQQEIIKNVITNFEEGASENEKGPFIELRNELTSISTSTATSTISLATSTITTSTVVTTSTEQIPLSLPL